MAGGLIGKILDRLKRQRVISGVNYDAEEGADGTILSFRIKGTSANRTAVPVKITNVHPDSPTGTLDVRMFQGDVYADGTDATASEEDVTIRVMGIAADEEQYFSDFMLAMPITETWTKSDSSTVTERVYHVINIENAGIQRIYEATADENAATDTIAAKALNQDGTLVGDTLTFDTLAE